MEVILHPSILKTEKIISAGIRLDAVVSSKFYHFFVYQEGLDIVQSQKYSLYAVCCNIIDPVCPDTTNLVSCIKVIFISLFICEFNVILTYYFNLLCH